MGDAAGSPKLNLFEERDDSPDTFMRGQRLFEENESPRSGDVNLRQIMMGDEGSRSAAIREQQKYNPQPQQGPPSYNQPSVWPGGGGLAVLPVQPFGIFQPIVPVAYPLYPPPPPVWPSQQQHWDNKERSGSLPAACPLQQQQQQQQSTRVIHNTSPLERGKRNILQKPKMWVRWTADEDELLKKAVQKHGDHDFNLISEQIFHGSRTETQCRNRWQRAVQPGIKTGKWSKEEDEMVLNAVDEHVKKNSASKSSAGGVIINWAEVGNKIPMRSVDQVRNRYTQRLDPTLKHGIWSEEEKRILGKCQCVGAYSL